MNTSSGQSAARAITAAASAALPQEAIASRRARKPAAGGQLADFQDAQVEHHPHEVAPLVRAGDVAGLVLDPQAPLEAERRGERRLPAPSA